MAKCVCPPPKKGAAKPKAKPKAKPAKSKAAKPTAPKPKAAKPKNPGGGKKPLKNIAKKGIEKKKGKRHGHPANMFILYFLDMYRQYGGNMYCVAKECGRRWREGIVSDADKAKYKRAYCAMCKNCKSCQTSKKK